MKSKKIFFILLIFCLLFCFSNNVFASSLTDTQYAQVLDKCIKHIESLGYSSSEYKKYVFTSYNQVCLVKNDDVFYDTQYSEFGASNSFYFSFNPDTLEFTDFQNWNNNSRRTIFKLMYIIYSNFDIKDGETIVFAKNSNFFLIPLPYQVPEIAEVTQLPEVIVGILKVIIPTGLIVLSVVFLIYLVKSVISRLV